MEENRVFGENIDKLRLTYKKLGIVFLVFAAICLITTLILDSSADNPIKADLPKTGGIVGPIEVKKDNAVYLIKVAQPVNTNQSSYVGGDVLDKNQEYLFGFGEDLWDEDGQDDEGYWHESQTNYEMKVTFPHKDTYYLQFETEMSNPDEAGNVSIEVTPKLASSLATFWLFILSLIAGTVFLFLFGSKDE